MVDVGIRDSHEDATVRSSSDGRTTMYYQNLSVTVVSIDAIFIIHWRDGPHTSLLPHIGRSMHALCETVDQFDMVVSVGPKCSILGSDPEFRTKSLEMVNTYGTKLRSVTTVLGHINPALRMLLSTLGLMNRAKFSHRIVGSAPDAAKLLLKTNAGMPIESRLLPALAIPSSGPVDLSELL